MRLLLQTLLSVWLICQGSLQARPSPLEISKRTFKLCWYEIVQAGCPSCHSSNCVRALNKVKYKATRRQKQFTTC